VEEKDMYLWMNQEDKGNISLAMSNEGNEKVRVTCYQRGMYHYLEASTSTILLQIEDFI
jgi:hypothetical protein